MPGIIKISTRMTVTNGANAFDQSVQNIQSDQTGRGVGPGSISVATAEQTLNLTGYKRVWIRNTDPINFVELGFATTVYKLVLYPSAAPTMVDLAVGVTLYLKSNIAPCEVDFWGVKI